MNDCHGGACGDHLYGLAIYHKILCVGYFFPSIFNYCIETFKKCSPCQICTTKKRTHPTSLHHVGEVGTFVKWGIECVHCRPTSSRGHGYIIMDVEYFTKWAEAMPTYAKDDKITALFLFNHIIARFGIPRAIVTDHGSHFRKKMMVELSAKLRFCHDNSTPYYPQANGQVEAINKVFKTMLQRMVGQTNSN